MKVGNVLAKKGELKKGYIEGPYLNNGLRLDTPVLVANGAEDGKTLQGRSLDALLGINFRLDQDVSLPEIYYSSVAWSFVHLLLICLY